jgi:putative ABC transport system permease protein
MTLPRFVIKNILRNKRRSLLTGISLAFSFLLLIFMVTIWRTFFVENWTAQGALRLICRHRASFSLSLPSYYEDKIRALPRVVNVTAANVFDGVYKTGRGQDEFGQFGADAETFAEVYPDFALPADQAADWKRDPAGAIASAELARNRGWKIGDRIMLEGVRYPVNLQLTLQRNLPFPHA